MCGIVGYIGNNLCKSYILKGLERLEYRGYDSAGFACLDTDTYRINHQKAEGQLINLINKLSDQAIDSHLGIGHTRWATHGKISEENAHPQLSCHKKVAVVHNGIIENHLDIRSNLEAKGHTFLSQTDSEVVAHLGEIISNKTTKDDVINIVTSLQGAYACLLMSSDCPETLIAIRKGSPLCIGLGHEQIIVASDPFAFAGQTNQVLFLPDQSFALISKNIVEVYDFSGHTLDVPISQVDITWQDDEKLGYKHIMLKEIYEQKNAIQATLSNCKQLDLTLWDQLGLTAQRVENLRSLALIGCGTSWHAGRIAQFFFEMICKVPTRVVLASEFRYAPFFHEENTLYCGISQSGETADTLECLRLLNTLDVPTMALTNVESSTMVRETGGFLLTKAGQEIAVASTKAFSTQLVALYWLAHRIALQKKYITMESMDRAHDDLLITAEILENSIEHYRIVIEEKLAPYYAQFKRFIFLGRHIGYPFAMEAALKLKEISYIFSQCYPAGELKHGPIALLDNDTPVILFSSLDERVYPKILSNAQEVKARNAHLVAFVFEGQDELQQLADCVFVFPKVHPLLAPLAMTGLMQYWVYSIANVLGCAIDKPRNLAKSVTVE
jgi:glutamine---fructose-6-phosphate transaminase (isomerizing)